MALLLITAQQGTADSHSVIAANDLKVTAEGVGSLANSIASRNEGDRQNLLTKINEFDNTFNTLRSGGDLGGVSVSAVPSDLLSIYEKVRASWDSYKQTAKKIQVEAVFDPDVRNALKYVLEKNGEFVITTDNVQRELLGLDRNYNKHKEIAMKLQQTSKLIGEDTLLISIGEGGNIHDKIRKDRILFEAYLRELLQRPLTDLDLSGLDIKEETLSPIPRENSDSLRSLDPLWEAIQLKLMTIESQSLISKEFGTALKDLNVKRIDLLSSIGELVNGWNVSLDKRSTERGYYVQGLLVADIAVFVFVLSSIRKSLNPLEALTAALSRVKEGIYGEKFEYKSHDEIGYLSEAFNTMTSTIKEKEDEAKKIEIAKDEFLAMITHELKTPLVPIQGYADILLAGHLGQLNKNQKERIEIIKSSSTSLLQLITDLLDAQKLELGQLKVKKEVSNLHSTIQKTIAIMAPQAMADQITLTTNLDADVYALYDEERIHQVLTNLIKNSFRAVEQKKGRVEILVRDGGDEVYISVRDNGRGIPNEALPKIFRRFYQVDTSTTREKGGSGLGLSISKGIIEAHGGTISAESEVGKGTTFTFTLPKVQQQRGPL
ncbi:MAG: ATP-binding protein [Thaumarchaeota archaeon]|nr:ATP-binding protein [Nitrososphaerota archaeon]